VENHVVFSTEQLVEYFDGRVAEMRQPTQIAKLTESTWKYDIETTLI